MFYYTEAFTRVQSQPVDTIYGIVANINAGYAASNINLRVRPFCIEESTSFQENNSPSRMLQSFRCKLYSGALIS